MQPEPQMVNDDPSSQNVQVVCVTDVSEVVDVSQDDGEGQG